MKLRFADCELDLSRRVLRRGGTPVAVEPQVYDLIALLAEYPDRLVTRDEIVERIWGGRIVSESAISARIASARKAVGDDGKRQAVIRTIQKHGLQMAVPVTGGEGPAPVDEDAAPTIRYAASDHGGSLAYALSGAGPPLVILDGAPVDIEAEWHVPSLRAAHVAIHRHFRLLRFNRRNEGLSSPSETLFDFDEFSDDLRAIADAAGFERFALVSYSGGCLDALHFAVRYPGRLSHLVMVGGYAEGRSIRENAAATEPLKAMLEQGWHELDSGFATGFLLTYFPEGPLEVVRDTARIMQQSARTEVFLTGRDQVNSASVVDLLPQVRCPTLIVNGRHDAVHPVSQAKILAAGIPNAELMILDTANHLPVVGHRTWEPFVTALVRFLKS